MIHLPYSFTDAQGRVWHPYAIEYDTPDGAFSTYIYAISDEHAQMMCADLRESARVTGQVIAQLS